MKKIKQQRIFNPVRDKSLSGTNGVKKIIAEISARHLHIAQADLEKLFGKNYSLKHFKDLSQPGEFASAEQVEVIGAKNKLTMRIVGPVRKQTQLELALSDARFLGVQPMIRVSGDLKGTPGGLTLKGPQGSLKLKTGVIVAQRHLHLSTKDARAWRLKNGQLVKAKVKGQRALEFDNIVVRVGNYVSRIHLDTDEANAAGLLSCSKIDLQI